MSDLILKAIKELKRRQYVTIPCFHGTTVWKFRASDLIKWLQGEYEIYTSSFCHLVLLNNKSGRAKVVYEYGAPEVTHFIHVYNSLEEAREEEETKILWRYSPEDPHDEGEGTNLQQG